MQKITEKIAALPKDGNYFSLEFFPPKTQMVRLFDRYAVQVTDGICRAFRTSNTGYNAWPLLSDPCLWQ